MEFIVKSKRAVEKMFMSDIVFGSNTVQCGPE